ncbi:MAG: NUDIX hydrolase [Bacillota bacterium]|nr:NUDIX hydrolase [Bacillota bacterium]
MIFEEKQISSQRIYEGAILNVRRDTVTAVKGRAYREIIEHNGAVAMVALTEDNKVVLVRQYRYACGDAVLEIPAGKIDKGETDPLKAAVRELKEETGYTAETIKFLGKINPSVAYSEEVIHIYAMTGLTPGEQSLDEDEAVEVLEVPFEEAYEMAAQGKLIDPKTISGLMMAKGQLGERLLP